MLPIPAGRYVISGVTMRMRGFSPTASRFVFALLMFHVPVRSRRRTGFLCDFLVQFLLFLFQILDL
jgi:hypothetical protein